MLKRFPWRTRGRRDALPYFCERQSQDSIGRRLLRHDFHFAGGRIVFVFHAVGRGRDFRQVNGAQFAQILRHAALGGGERLDGAVEADGIEGFLGASFAGGGGAEIFNGREGGVGRGRRGGRGGGWGGVGLLFFAL